MSEAATYPKRRTITFSKSMTKALIAGRKTQTRRLAVRAPEKKRYRNQSMIPTPSVWTKAQAGDVLLCTNSPYNPPFARAELIEVRSELLHEMTAADALAEGIVEDGAGGYTADPDARHLRGATPLDAFRVLWETLHGPGAWEKNPRVVVLRFRMLDDAQ